MLHKKSEVLIVKEASLNLFSQDSHGSKLIVFLLAQQGGQNLLPLSKFLLAPNKMFALSPQRWTVSDIIILNTVFTCFHFLCSRDGYH